MLDRGWTVAVAESCTGGLLAKRLTDVPGSSRYLKGGVVAYANEAKAVLLGVSSEIIRDHGAVSGEVAGAMAAGAARAFDSEVGVAVTGIAGPEGAVPGKPVGTVWFGLSLPEGIVTEEAHFSGDRAGVRAAAAEYAMGLLVRQVSRPPSRTPSAENPTGSHG